jgi:hypothetical protein
MKTNTVISGLPAADGISSAPLLNRHKDWSLLTARPFRLMFLG